MKCNTIAELERFLEIQEQALGEMAPEVATTAAKLAELHLKAGNLVQAEALFQRVLHIREKLRGFHQEDLVQTRDDLKRVEQLKTTGENLKAVPQKDEVPNNKIGSTPPVEKEEPTKPVAVSRTEPVGTNPGAAMDHHSTPRRISGDTSAITDAMKEAEIEIELLKQMVGPEHPSVADLLTKLADLYCRLRMYSQMEPVLVEALKIRESACGENHVSVSTELKNLARLYLVQERYALAEPLFKRALAIRERNYGRMHPRVADIEEQYAQLLRKTNRAYQAEALDQHVDAIRSQHLGDSSVGRKTSMFNRGSW